MCNSFIVKNFRAFEEIKIPRLAKVNLFLGKNSVGKTALLEAFYIYLHKNKVEAIYELLLKKEEHLSSKEDLASVIKHLFHNHKLPIPGERGILLAPLKGGKVVNSKSVTIATDVKKDFDDSLIINTGTKKTPEQRHSLARDFREFYRRSRMFEDYNHESNLRFVYSVGIDNVYIANLWDNIAFESKQDSVIQALKIVEKELSDVAFIEAKNHRDRVAIAKVSGEKVPFKSMGDGINRILHIILSMVNAQDGYLLIDEFENGLHYSVQEQVWEVIFSLAESLNVQVFATTHSSDCIKAFGSQWENNKENATMHRIDYKDKRHSVMPYDFSDLNDALSTNTEVR
ncbi:hypothetical protein [uncultured Gammaproteobacteria bacterium]|nr:hypothetical protein [uncultured Gammaproteobacteria bacterium]